MKDSSSSVSDTTTVLVIGGDDRLLSAIVLPAAQADFRVVSAESGDAALRQIQTEPLDLLLLCFQLPEMTGLDWLRRLPVDIRSALPDVILIAAESELPGCTHLSAYGVRDCLILDPTFPIRLPLILAQIRQQRDRIRTEAGLRSALQDREKRYRELFGSDEEAAAGEDSFGDAVTRFRTFADNTTDWEFWMTPDNRFLYVSPSVKEITGYEAHEFINDPDLYLRIIHPEDLAIWTAHYDDAVKHRQGEDGDVEFRIIHRDQSTRWIGHRCKPVYDRGGRYLGVRGSNRNNTRYKLATEALRASEERYRPVVEAAREGIWSMNAGFRTTWVSEQMAEMLGYKAEEMIGRPVTDFMVPDDLVDHLRQMAVRKQGGNTQYERRFVCKDGRIVFHHVSASGLHDSEGRFAGSVALLTDITDRKQAERELELSREKYRDLVESIGETIYSLDIEGRLTYVSPVIKFTLGYEPEEVLGRVFTDIIYPADVPFILDRFANIRNDVVIPSEYRVLSKTGETRWIRSSTRSIMEGGRVVGFRGVFSDITDRRKAEIELESHHARQMALIESIGQPLFSVNREYSYTAFNSACCEMMKALFGAEIIVGGNILEYYSDLGQRAVVKALLDRVWTGETVAEELTGESDRGRQRRYLFEFNPIRDPNGHVTGAAVFANDLTERIRMEDALRASEEKYRSIIENISDLYYRTDRNGNLVLINPAFAATLGYGSEDLIGRPATVIWMDPAQRPVFLARLMKEGVVTDFEMVAACKDGSPRWMSVSSRVYRDGGEVAGVEGFLRDITERKRDLERLRESEQSLSKAQRLAKVGSWVWDIPTDRLEWSDEIYHMFGLDKSRFSGSLSEAMQQAIHPDDLDFVRDCTRRVVLHKQPFPWEFRAIRPDGSIRIIRSEAGEFATGADGNLIRISGILQDITDQKHAEDALRESEKRYRDLIDLLPIGVFVQRDFHLLLVNRTAARFFGIEDPAELIGKSVLGLIPADNHEFVRERVAAALESGQPADLVEQKMLRRDGTPFWAEVMGTPIAFDGEPAFLVVFDDISDRIEAEAARQALTQQLRQSQKMEAVGRLAGGIAHDFNNLLTVIAGHTEIALGRLHSNDPMRAEIEDISGIARKSANLARQLLAFSRKQIMAPVLLDLNAVVGNLNLMLQRIIGENIHLETSAIEGLWTIKADPGQMEQVIANLAINARDAMPDGGTLSIETSNVVLDADFTKRHPDVSPGRYILLSVSDTGIGMNADIQSRIFEPFFTTKPMGEGTGLGLSTVYGIVKQSGGHIFVDSEEGNGSTFSLYFPVIAELAGANDDLPAEDRHLEGCETVLLVEDSGAVMRVLKQVLENYGYQVIAAQSGEDALDWCRNTADPADLMVSDVILPGVNGFDLATQVRQVCPRLRIMLISGYSADTVPQMPSEVRWDVLQKPFGPIQFLTRVRDTLDR